MPKQSARLIFFAAIGAVLALLAMWISGRRDAGNTSSGPVRRPSATAPVTGEPTDRTGGPTRARSNREPPEPELISLPREISERAPASELGRSDAAAVDLKLDLAADRTTPAESVTRPDDQERGAPAEGPERPLGWCFRSTLNSDLASDSRTVWNGSRSALVRQHNGVEPDYRVNVLWQGVDATAYRASRVEVSAHVQTAGMVFLFLQAATRRALLLANNQLQVASANNRYFVSPTQSWTRLSIVGDIPPDADVLYFGVANNGRSSLWVDDVGIASVGPDVPVTLTASQNAPLSLQVDPGSILATPINLDFEVTNVTSGSDALPPPPC
jgi:hypothetical protein